MPRSSPVNVGSSAMNAVTWVSANTNTRSKKSSSGETRASASAARMIACERAGAAAPGVADHRPKRPRGKEGREGSGTARRLSDAYWSS